MRGIWELDSINPIPDTRTRRTCVLLGTPVLKLSQMNGAAEAVSVARVLVLEIWFALSYGSFLAWQNGGLFS